MGGKAGLERRNGHKRGGAPEWRHYGRTKPVKAEVPQESFWTKYATGERRDTAYMAEADRRSAPRDTMTLKEWVG